MFTLSDKVTLVTGAGRGMGRSHALVLAQQEAGVAVTDVDEKAAQAVADEIRKQGGRAEAYRLDVSDKTEVDAVFGRVVEQFGSLDILVNNAGILSASPALDMAPEEWERVLRVNLTGQFLCAQRAAKEMAKKKWGRIINIASIASGGVGIGYVALTHYSASKGGIIAMTESLSAEWADLGITVNAVAPGVIDTPMVDPFRSGMDDMIKTRVPLKRMGRPEEVSAVVAFLASEEASYVTGATYVVDGGYLAT